jgi:hypothetical protein
VAFSLQVAIVLQEVMMQCTIILNIDHNCGEDLSIQKYVSHVCTLKNSHLWYNFRKLDNICLNYYIPYRPVGLYIGQ